MVPTRCFRPLVFGFTAEAPVRLLQLSADDYPPDYETSIGGPPTNAISSASEVTVNESSVVLDSSVRTMDFQELHANMLTEAPSGGESHIIASSK